MIDRPRWRASLLFTAGLVLMGAAVALGRHSTGGAGRAWLWSAIVAYACALAVLALALRKIRGLQEPDYDPAALARALCRRLRAGAWRWLLGGSALAQSLGAGVRAGQPLTSQQGYRLLAIWGVASILWTLAVVDWRRVRSQLAVARPFTRDGLRLWVPLLTITLLAGLVRLVQLGQIPYLLSGDEANMGWEALEVQAGRLTNPFATGWFSHPTLFFYLQALGLRLWPDPAAGLRLVPALAGTLTIPAVYLLAREIFDRRVALVAALFLACWHYPIHFSRVGLNNILDPLFAALALALLLRGLRTGHAADFGVAGVLMGLAQYGYMSARLIPLVVGGYLLWKLATERNLWASHRQNLALLAVGFAVTAWPLLLFWARHTQDLLARVTALSMLQPGRLESSAATAGMSPAALLGEQFLRALLGWHYYPDTSPHYAPGRSLLGVVDGAIFMVGLVMTMLPGRRRGAGLLALLFWAVAIMLGALLESPPTVTRLLLSTISVPILLASGAWDIADALGKLGGWRQIHSAVLVLLCVAAISASNLYFYLGVYTPGRTYGGLNSEVGYRLGLYLRALPAGSGYVFYGAPRMFAGYPTVRYLAPDVEGVDVEQLETGAGFASRWSTALHVLLPERLTELDQVRSAMPGGTLRRFERPSGELLFAVYAPGLYPVTRGGVE